MPTLDEQITLANIGQGAAAEKFQIELQKVIQNIRDINTKPGNRQIILTVTLHVTEEDRSMVGIGIDCVSKLQGYETYRTKAIVGLGSDGRAEANEYIPQEQMKHPGMNVTPMRPRNAGGGE